MNTSTRQLKRVDNNDVKVKLHKKASFILFVSLVMQTTMQSNTDITSKLLRNDWFVAHKVRKQAAVHNCSSEGLAVVTLLTCEKETQTKTSRRQINCPRYVIRRNQWRTNWPNFSQKNIGTNFSAASKIGQYEPCWVNPGYSGGCTRQHSRSMSTAFMPFSTQRVSDSRAP